MWWYFQSYFREERVRVMLTAAGLACSLSAIVLAYGLAAWVDLNSSKALAYVIHGGSVWIVPPEGASVDNQLGAILTTGRLPESVTRSVKRADPEATITRTAVRKAKMNQKPIVFYASDGITGRSLLVSPEIWAELGKAPKSVTMLNLRADIAGTDPALPPTAVAGAFGVWANAINAESAPSWIVVSSTHPRSVANALSEEIGARVTDSPDQIGSAGIRPAVTVFLLNTSLSRFDPFSFRTKFSSMILNSALSTIFGWVARVIFVIGFVLGVTSTLIGIVEKRREIGLFSALGFQNDVTLLFLAESALVSLTAFVLAFIIATALLLFMLPPGVWTQVAGPALVMGLMYGLLLVVIIPLIAAQQVASKKANELVREAAKS